MQVRPALPAWLRALGLALFALALSTFAWWPALMAHPSAQGGDGPFFHEMIEVIRVSVFRYHELPLWNPFQCGGVPLWDNPQGLSAAPILWPLLAFDTARAVELWYVVHSAIGFCCMWALVRGDLRLSRPASVVASAMWAFAGVHNQHLTGGHFVWVPYLYYPLGLYLWRRAERDMRAAVGLGILVALEMHEGGTYPLPHLALILAGETMTRMWPPQRVLAVVKAAGVVAVVGFCLGASRILPVMDQLRSHTRHLGEEWDALQLTTLKEMFLARTHSRGVPGQQYVWPEFADYLGPLLLGLSLLGVALSGLENAWILALLVYSLALMGGHESPRWPWSILKGHIFPFKEMRVPSRFNAAVTLFLAPLAGIAIDRVRDIARRVFRSRSAADAITGAFLAIGLVGVGDMIGVGIDWCQTCFTNAPNDSRIVASPRLYLGGPGIASFIDEPAQNRGRIECWEEWAFARDAELWQGDVAQARSPDPAVSLANIVRTPNTFSFDVSSPQHPAHVVVNGTWDRGWRASFGEVADDAELLAVDVPTGYHHVVLSYWPHGLTAGLTLAGLGSAAVIAFFVWDARRRRAAAG
ncbi:MAG: hypothetical protein ACLQVI_03555 [Polyangiaceae bacterium]